MYTLKKFPRKYMTSQLPAKKKVFTSVIFLYIPRIEGQIAEV